MYERHFTCIHIHTHDYWLHLTTVLPFTMTLLAFSSSISNKHSHTQLSLLEEMYFFAATWRGESTIALVHFSFFLFPPIKKKRRPGGAGGGGGTRHTQRQPCQAQEKPKTRHNNTLFDVYCLPSGITSHEKGTQHPPRYIKH